MPADCTNPLTTGQAARLCSVTPDTILKWIKKGQLRAVRTAGGHYRIQRGDLQPLIASPRPTADASRRAEECPQRGLRCWEYLGARDAVRDECRQCVVYRVRAARCFLMADLEPDVGHARRFCQTSCEECVYYHRVRDLATKVLVITSDEELVSRLTREENESISLRFARNAYEASAVIHDFRPAFAVLDVGSIAAGSTELLESLANDSRVPGLKITIVLPPGMPGWKRGRSKYDSVVSVLTKPFGSRRIAAVINDFPVDFLTPEESNPQTQA